MTRKTSTIDLDLSSIGLSQRVKYPSHAFARNVFLYLRQILLASESVYSSRENRVKYEKVWTEDRPDEPEQSSFRIGKVDNRVVKLPLETQYAYIVSLVADEIRGQQSRVRQVAEVGAGSGRVLIPLAKQFPEIRFHAIEPTHAGCLKVAESAKRYDLQNVEVHCCSAEEMRVSLRLQVQFVYTNLALEQIGELSIAELALRNTIALLSSDGCFFFREPWGEVNGLLKRSYLRSAKYWPLSAGVIHTITSRDVSVEQCRVQHNLRFNVGICRGAV